MDLVTHVAAYRQRDQLAAHLAALDHLAVRGHPAVQPWWAIGIGLHEDHTAWPSRGHICDLPHRGVDLVWTTNGIYHQVVKSGRG